MIPILKVSSNNYFKVYRRGKELAEHPKDFTSRVELVFPFFDGSEDATLRALHDARRAQGSIGAGAQLSVWRKPSANGPGSAVDVIGAATVPMALRGLT